ncbi:MAG: carboxypeptidase-like regulatory domain-containing protein, partial [Terracidiphilus sp.]
MKLKFRILGPGILLIAFLHSAEHATAQAPSPSASLHGTVLDPSGAAIAGALVTVKGAGRGVQTDSDADGQYSLRGLRPGNYSVEAKAKGFDAFRLDHVAIAAGESRVLDLKLTIAVEKEEVTVAGTNEQVGVGADQNASATIIRGSALNALSDDPNELQSELQTLAGPAAGPNGGEIY